MIEYYGRERYRFFVVFMIEGGAFAVAGAAGVDCEGGRDAGGIESGLGAAALGEGLTKSAQTATNARMSRDMLVRLVAFTIRTSRLIGLINVLRNEFN